MKYGTAGFDGLPHRTIPTVICRSANGTATQAKNHAGGGGRNQVATATGTPTALTANAISRFASGVRLRAIETQASSEPTAPIPARPRAIARASPAATLGVRSLSTPRKSAGGGPSWAPRLQ